MTRWSFWTWDLFVLRRSVILPQALILHNVVWLQQSWAVLYRNLRQYFHPVIFTLIFQASQAEGSEVAAHRTRRSARRTRRSAHRTRGGQSGVCGGRFVLESSNAGPGIPAGIDWTPGCPSSSQKSMTCAAPRSCDIYWDAARIMKKRRKTKSNQQNEWSHSKQKKRIESSDISGVKHFFLLTFI